MRDKLNFSENLIQYFVTKAIPSSVLFCDLISLNAEMFGSAIRHISYFLKSILFLNNFFFATSALSDPTGINFPILSFL